MQHYALLFIIHHYSLLLVKIAKDGKMLFASRKCADFQRNVLWQRKDPRCIQDEVISYRGIKLLEKQQQQQQQQTEKDRAVDEEIALMAKGIEVHEKVSKRKFTSVPCKVKMAEIKVDQMSVESDDLKSEIKQKDLTIKNLNNTLAAVYEQSLHQFDKMSADKSHLLDEHNRKIIQCRELKSKAKLLQRERDLSNLRSSNMERLVSETMNEHEETKAKLRAQLALTKKQTSEIQDLKVQLTGKEQTLLDADSHMKKIETEKIRQNKFNANVLMNLQKEVDGNEKALLEERQMVQVLRLQLVEKSKIIAETDRDLKKMVTENIRKESLNENVVINLENKLDESKKELKSERAKCEELKKNYRDVEEKLRLELTTKIKLQQNVDQLKDSLSLKNNENRVLAKNLSASGARVNNLQAALNKTSSDLMHFRRIGDKEKNVRKSLSNKLLEVTSEKDAQLAKLRKKLEATKAYLATISQSKQNEVKAHQTKPLASGKDMVVQSEEKNKQRRRKKKKGTSKSSAESLETKKSVENVNSQLLLKGEGKEAINIK